MKFDNIIIGGGLSGLMCGIKLAGEGQQCAIISSGQSAIHFFSGSFDLLSKINDVETLSPLESMQLLPEQHPYKRIGLENIPHLGMEAPGLLEKSGIRVKGSSRKNHFVLTPMGTLKPTWLTLGDFSIFDHKESLPWKIASIINIKGFLDFQARFIKDGLLKFDVDAEIKTIAMKEFESIRRNPSEMRSSNIAKVLDRRPVLKEFAQTVNHLSEGSEVVILPAVFGLAERELVSELKGLIDKTLVLIPAIPPSVPGIRTQMQLQECFRKLGGTLFSGDIVEGGEIKNKRLLNINTQNHGDIKLEADNFVLASGSFYSKGIRASRNMLSEPVFGLDVDGVDQRDKWFDADIFKDQPFMHFGLKTNSEFKAIKNDQVIENLYLAGSVLGGANPLKEGSGAGISILTSLYVADQILK